MVSGSGSPCGERCPQVGRLFPEPDTFVRGIMDGQPGMSKIVHRKPVWGWSAVLLSTLLLSPMATATVVQALAQAPWLLSGTSSLASGGDAAPRGARRADAEAALRAARSERPLTLRLDADPDVVALVVPRRALLLVLVPDDVSALHAPVFEEALPSRSGHPRPSRAPPSVSRS
uniref:Uncharacterized protein n=1 Tax=uncultured Armatimonadetes bacterium TaxID=157466 RepID=A0A6J4JHT0_9BACT|nr:hypothetical protein AVDCRST_MAG63-3442 [uncultured Armatimonadetes bacterium]